MSHILIVDDNTAIRELFRTLLESEGYAVAEAADGKLALDSLATGTPPALILLDVNMPVLNGKDFLLRLKMTPSLSKIPVIVVAAIESTDVPPGAVHFFKKPADLDELLAVISKTMKAHSSSG